MNPFLAFLIVVPLCGALFLAAAAGAVLLETRSIVGPAIAFIILSSITSSLAYLFYRASRGRGIEFPGSDRLDPRFRQLITTALVGLAYLMLVGAALLVWSVPSVRYWIAAVSSALGILCLLASVDAARRSMEPPQGFTGEMLNHQAMILERAVTSQERVRWYLFASLGIFAVLGPLCFVALPGQRYLAGLDLAGILFLAFSLSVWFSSNLRAQGRRLAAVRKRLEELSNGALEGDSVERP